MSTTVPTSETPDPPQVHPPKRKETSRRSWWRRLLGFLLPAILALPAILFWVLGTQGGLHFSLSLVKKLAPDLLQVERVDGRILGDLHLRGLRVRAPGLALDLDYLDLRWRPFATLADGTLRISELRVSGLNIATAPATDTTEDEKPGPVALPSIRLPFRIELEQAVVESLSIGTLGEEARFRIDRIALATDWSGSTLTLKQLTFALPKPMLEAAAQGKLEVTGDYPMTLELSWSLAQQPNWELIGTTTVAGDLEALRVKQQLTGSAQAELRALIRELREQPSWEGELKIRQADLRAFQADLPMSDLSGTLTTSGDLDDARVQGNLVAVLNRPDPERIETKLDIGWQSSVLEIAALELTSDKSDTRLTADGTLDLSHPTGPIDLKAAWQQLRWPLVEAPVVEVNQGRLRLHGDLDEFGYRLSSEVRGPDLPAAQLELAGSGNREATRIQGLRIAALDGEIEAQGRVAWSPEPSWALTLTTAGIDLGTRWPQLPARIGLELTSQGNPDAFTYALQARMKSPVLPATALTLNGQGNSAGAHIDELRLNALDGSLQATADVAWTPAVTWDAQLAIADVNPGKQWPEWDGALGGRILSRGGLAAEGAEFSAELESLTGQLRGYPVGAAAKIRRQGNELRIDELQVTSGPNHLKATGSVGERLDLTLDLDAPNLAALLPDTQGRLQASGAITGTLETPAAQLDLSGDGIAVAGQGIHSLRGSARIDLTPDGPVQLDLAGQDLVVGGLAFDRLRVRGNGNMGAHRLSAQLTGAPLALDLEVAGSQEDTGAYAGRLTDLVLHTGEFGRWRLERAAPIRLASGARIDAGPICIREQAGSGGCASFAQPQTGHWKATLDVAPLDFALFKDFIPEDLSLQGKATAKADFAATAGTLISRARIRIPEGILDTRHSEGRGHPTLLRFAATQLTIDTDSNGLQARFTMPLEGLGNLSADVSLPGWSPDRPVHPPQPLRGGVQARIQDFGRFAHLAPDIEQLTGNLKADFELGGSLAKPGLEGSARIADGSLRIPFIGLKIEDLNLTAEAESPDRITYRGGLRAGAGTLKIEGLTRVKAAGTSTRITAKGNRLTLANSKEYFVQASPDIAVEIGPEATKITGTVRVPEARIRPRRIPAGTISASPDVVVTAEAGTAAQSRYATSLNLRLILGRKVTVDAFGLEGTIQGELAVLQAPGKEMLGNGQLKIVDSTYRISTGGGLSAAIGKPLTIEQGFLNYAKSPITNPLLILTAQREGGDITANLRVFGTIKDPKMTFFSATDPGLSQAEVTKYLLTGIPPTSNGEQDRAVSLGTYVAPKLFVEYDYSLGDESDKIRLRYDLNDHLELQAETGDAQGSDIFYKFEH